ncbi:MAG: hypothetical protein PVF10_12755, partial [Syntrophobacterales bacterium]
RETSGLAYLKEHTLTLPKSPIGHGAPAGGGFFSCDFPSCSCNLILGHFPATLHSSETIFSFLTALVRPKTTHFFHQNPNLPFTPTMEDQDEEIVIYRRCPGHVGHV